ncbi:flavin-containing monooxygenase [Nocardia jinanensis]|uniref:Monooxygenase n=1 Tax=Nocardia jinanensis TaxID=382504 RepID=A0A917RLK4_9NOCA|nr:NAD(P)/FAD-dependent oxidoreductase [Nocardia jinanensis]GGL13332.1 monooxygenase [Nocardia jinanensis]
MVDDDFLNKALHGAELGALRIALYQATGDPEIAGIPLEEKSVRGGAGALPVVPQAYHARLKAAAARFLREEAGNFVPRVPDADEIDRLIRMAHLEPVSAAALAARRDLLAFDEYTRQTKPPAGGVRVPDGFQVIVVGAGFSGIAMGVQLGLLGIPYTVLERRSEAGGVWSVNTYPDARVDTLSATYQFSFEKNHRWTEHFARQGEVRSYLETVAHKHGVYEHIRFEHDVVRAEWYDQEAEWELTVRTSDGSERSMRAGVVVSAAGLFALPRALDLPGAGEFRGEIVHTTAWQADRSVEGRRVAVIGNGSTGVQLLGAVAREADHVSVFQRTPQWISPREKYGEPLGAEEQWLLHAMPYYWNWSRYTAVVPLLDAYDLLVPDPEWIASGGKVNQRNDMLRDILVGYMRAQLGDRQDLLDALTPDYAPIARRPVVDNGWYKALTRDNVELVTTPIECLTPDGIRTTDGRDHPLDLIIAAIGFETDRYLWSTEYLGRSDSLHEHWAESGAEAFLGMAVPGFPNMFILYGPNSQPVAGANTLPMWFEVWSSYIAQCLLAMFDEGARRIEVRKDVCDEYNDRLQRRAAELVYLSGEGVPGSNYYVNSHGKLGVNAPWDFEEYHEQCIRPDLDHFILS